MEGLYVTLTAALLLLLTGSQLTEGQIFGSPIFGNGDVRGRNVRARVNTETESFTNVITDRGLSEGPISGGESTLVEVREVVRFRNGKRVPARAVQTENTRAKKPRKQNNKSKSSDSGKTQSNEPKVKVLQQNAPAPKPKNRPNRKSSQTPDLFPSDQFVLGTFSSRQPLFPGGPLQFSTPSAQPQIFNSASLPSQGLGIPTLAPQSFNIPSAAPLQFQPPPPSVAPRQVNIPSAVPLQFQPSFASQQLNIPSARPLKFQPPPSLAPQQLSIPTVVPQQFQQPSIEQSVDSSLFVQPDAIVVENQINSQQPNSISPDTQNFEVVAPEFVPPADPQQFKLELTESQAAIPSSQKSFSVPQFNAEPQGFDVEGNQFEHSNQR